jgi:hypothetical protein
MTKRKFKKEMKRLKEGNTYITYYTCLEIDWKLRGIWESCLEKIQEEDIFREMQGLNAYKHLKFLAKEETILRRHLILDAFEIEVLKTCKFIE